MSLSLLIRLSCLTRARICNKSLSTFVSKPFVKPVLLQTQFKALLPVMSQSFSSLPDVVTYEVIKQLPKQKDVLLIDVREPKELVDTGIVPASINIPLGQVAEKLSKDFSEQEFMKLFNRKKPSHDTQLIFMCKIGRRSQNALEMSRQLGYKKLSNYVGSWDDWSKNEGLSK